jgi:hypothetical protein
MGFSIGSIVSEIASVAADPGKLVGQLADSVLPSSMKAVGDILGGIVDLNTGHPLQALSHLGDTLKDLPQLLPGQTGAQAKTAATPAGTAGAEPSPPPPRAASSSASATTSSAPATTPAASTPAASTTPASATPAPPASSTPASATPASPASSTGAPSSAPAGAQAPSVTVRRFGNETITRVDDGTHTTTIDQKGRRTTVSVTSDAPPSSAAGASTTNATTASGASTPTPAASTTGSPSPTSPGSSASAQAPSVTVRRFGNETITRVDDGVETKTVDQRGRQTTVSVTSDAQVAGGWHAAPPPGGPAAGPSAPATTGAAPAVSSSSNTGTASSPSSASSTSAASTGASAAGSSATTSSTTASNSTGASSATPPKDLASLMALSPDQFMQAVTSGKIPPDVANNQSAMMQVQARMNSITQMNQLVTSMMAAMHQMQMSIIQNIRC